MICSRQITAGQIVECWDIVRETEHRNLPSGYLRRIIKFFFSIFSGVANVKPVVTKISTTILMIVMLLSACQTPCPSFFTQGVSPSDDLQKTLRLDYETTRTKEGFSGQSNFWWERQESVFYIVTEGIMKWSRNDGASVILSENDIGGIVVDESWLYYYTIHEMAIFRIDLDGKHKELVFNTTMITDSELESQVCSFAIYNKMLYIWDSTISCFSFNLVTGEQKRFQDDVSSGVFLLGKFYYVDYAQRTFSIYVTDLETGDTELIRGDGVTCEFEKTKEGAMYDKLTVIGENLFYSTRGTLAIYQYRENGQDILIKDFPSSTLENSFVSMLTDNRCLYFTLDGTNMIGKYDPTSKKKEQLCTPDDFDANGKFSIIQSILYYWSADGVYRALDV